MYLKKNCDTNGVKNKNGLLSVLLRENSVLASAQVQHRTQIQIDEPK